MIKRFTGQDLFIILSAVTALIFIYVVLLMTSAQPSQAEENTKSQVFAPGITKEIDAHYLSLKDAR